MVVVWESGTQRRVSFVDDMAESVYFSNVEISTYEENTQPMLSHINIGTGVDVTIKELAGTVKEVVGFKGNLAFDETKLDGTMRKLLDVTKLETLGYVAPTTLLSGLELAYADFLINGSKLRM